MLKINAEKVKAKELQPGDLFSTAGPDYWNHGRPTRAIGERVFIRTEAPPWDEMEAQVEVYRITIEREERTC